MKPARVMEHGVVIFCWGAALGLFSALAWILGFLVLKGHRALNLELIFGDTEPLDALLLRVPVFDGLFPAIAGTLALVALSVTWAIPIGLASGIYLAEYARPRLKRVLGLFLDIMAGIPSILIGLFGLAVAILLHRLNGGIRPCLLISSVALACLVLPYVIRSTQLSLEDLPLALRLTGPALGASKLQNIRHVLLPRCASGIFSGIVLAIGRCAEDTAVILLTGVVAVAGVPRSLFGTYEALPFYIYHITGNYSDHDELSRAYGAALILVMVCVMLFLLASAMKHRLHRRTRLRA
jgi:phosphate transport system permease protein